MMEISDILDTYPDLRAVVVLFNAEKSAQVIILLARMNGKVDHEDHIAEVLGMYFKPLKSKSESKMKATIDIFSLEEFENMDEFPDKALEDAVLGLKAKGYSIFNGLIDIDDEMYEKIDIGSVELKQLYGKMKTAFKVELAKMDVGADVPAPSYNSSDELYEWGKTMKRKW